MKHIKYLLLLLFVAAIMSYVALSKADENKVLKGIIIENKSTMSSLKLDLREKSSEISILKQLNTDLEASLENLQHVETVSEVIDEQKPFEISDAYRSNLLWGPSYKYIPLLLRNVLYENGLDDDKTVTYYLCKPNDIEIDGRVIYTTKFEENYPVSVKELYTDYAKIILDIDGEKHLINNDKIKPYSITDGDYDLLKYVFSSGKYTYKSFDDETDFYNEFCPIIFNDHFIGYVKDKPYLEKMPNKHFFQTQVPTDDSYKSFRIQSDELRGGELVQVIADGENKYKAILAPPISGYEDVIYSYPMIEERLYHYLAIGASHDLKIVHAINDENKYTVDIDGDGKMEVFEWHKGEWLLLSDKYFHYYKPFTIEIEPTEQIGEFQGYFLDINGDGVLEHVIINNKIPDFTSIKIYDLRLSPSENPVIDYVINGVN